MELFPLSTGMLSHGDDLAAALVGEGRIHDGDIVAVSSKVIAMTEGQAVSLRELQISEEAKTFAEQCGRSAGFCEAVIRETKRLNGNVIGTCKGALLTQLRPEGMKEGILLVPNAGMDESNIAKGFAVGWPHDPIASLIRLRKHLGKVGMILTDSCCAPMRNGVTAFALACVGVDPFKSEVGNEDLCGNRLVITVEAVADQLAIAGNFLMGNAAQSVPAALIRDHGLPLTNFAGWVNGMDPEKDLFKDVFKEL